MSAPEKHIEVRDLRLNYGPREVIHGISFDVYRNEIFGIIGPAQSGKTSLLRCLNRTIDFTPEARVQGTIRLDGRDVRQDANVYALRRKVGMVAPLPVGLPLSIYDNVAFALRRRGAPDDEVRRRVAELLDVVDMTGTEHLMPADLSGGMKKRVSVARALATQPDVVLYDEPTSGLDPVLAAAVDHLIAKLRDDVGISAIVVTHDVAHLFAYADRAMMLYEGKVIATGTPDELRGSGNPVVRQFITGSIDGPIKV